MKGLAAQTRRDLQRVTRISFLPSSNPRLTAKPLPSEWQSFGSCRSMFRESESANVMGRGGGMQLLHPANGCFPHGGWAAPGRSKRSQPPFQTSALTNCGIDSQPTPFLACRLLCGYLGTAGCEAVISNVRYWPILLKKSFLPDCPLSARRKRLFCAPLREI